MLILHDALSADLTHIQAIAAISEGIALFDYVRIRQPDGATWIGQVVQPNQNISTVGNRLDPTILHGLRLMQTHPDVQSVQSVQVFDILILGQYLDSQLLTPRLRPLPGSVVTRLDSAETAAVIEIPPVEHHEDGTTNVIGELLNAEDVPLCLDERKFNYHIMVAGGTGSGKSNVAANLVDQALKYGKCVLIHDAKPDYGLIRDPNTDPRVRRIWERFEEWRLFPHGADNLKRVGFYGVSDPSAVDEVVGFRSSDFYPDMLAGLFFTGPETAEQNAFEGFVLAASHLYRQAQLADPGRRYTLDDILTEVRRRTAPDNGQAPNLPPEETIHAKTGPSILQKVTRRRPWYPWLDAVGKPVQQPSLPGPRGRVSGPARLQSSELDGARQVTAFDLERLVEPGRVLVIDYARVEDHSYAVLLSYFLREGQRYRKPRLAASPSARAGARPGLVQLVDEAHRLFDNKSRHGPALASAFERVMREGRSADHSILLSLQNASQIPHRVMNNLNTRVVMRQNSRAEAEAATETMGRDFAAQALRLGTGHALVSLHESRAPVLGQMAPSPYELMRQDNTGPARRSAPAPQRANPSPRPPPRRGEGEPEQQRLSPPPLAGEGVGGGVRRASEEDQASDDDIPF
ncbi:MAG: ATP-binding protein [Gemmataceae bacterium]|nr:ATP-binding protein [Gemmataceae bacterium]